MSGSETQSEDLTILAAVEALERDLDAPDGEPRQDETEETLARLYTEVLGLIPFELAAEEPSPAVRTRLMALVHGDETLPAPATRPATAAAPPRSSAKTSPRRLASPPAVAGRDARPRRWPLALAATLAFLLLGLSLWLYLQLGQQRQTIVQLRQELGAERTRVVAALAQARALQASQADLQDLQQKFALVTSRAVEVAPMRAVGKPPLQPAARGILFVASDHQHWYLTLEGLQPAAGSQIYKLWFEGPQGPVDAGSFTARPGEPLELRSTHMPAGTKGVMVTLEEDPQAATPAGPEILRAAAVYQIS